MTSQNTKYNLRRGDIIHIAHSGRNHRKMIYEGNIGNKEAFLEDGLRINTLHSWRFPEIKVTEIKTAETDFTKAELYIYKKSTKEFDDNCGLVLKLKETNK